MKSVKTSTNSEKINNLNDEARAHHMTYGQYTAFLYCQEQKKKEKQKEAMAELYYGD